MEALISEIQIYEDRQPNGQWLKSIKFRLPIIEVTMDYETIVPNQKPGKATYKMITDYVKEKYNLVVKSTTIAEVKRSFGLEV